MKKFIQFFQLLSYLQYPFMLLGLYFAIQPYLNGITYMIENPVATLGSYNNVLVLMGLGISFSTLQDTTKTQNNFSKRIWQNPKKGKFLIITILVLILFFLSYGTFGYFITDNEMIQELSFGSIVFSIGLIGFLKAALEVFENHREDRQR